MFSFPRTRMLREAELGGRGPYTTGRLIGFFFLVFLASAIGQSVILTPAQVISFVTSDSFQAIMADGSMPLLDRLTALSEADIASPPWVMAVQLFSTAAMVVACILFCRLIEKRSLASMGLFKRGAVPEYLVGLVIGFAMLTAALALCSLSEQVNAPWEGYHISLKHTPWLSIVLFFAGYLIQGLSEELLCRSFLMVSLARGHKPWFCVLLNSLLFSALHVFNTGITLLALLNLTLFGIFASVYTLRRGSIWGIAAIHSMWNFTQGNIFGISVSGMDQAPSLYHVDLSGLSPLIGGGSFGLEGGFAVTAVLVIATAVVLMTPTKRSEIAA